MSITKIPGSSLACDVRNLRLSLYSSKIYCTIVCVNHKLFPIQYKYFLAFPSSAKDLIGLYRMETPVNFTDRVRPICLPTAAPSVGDQLTIVGYGQGNSDFFSPPGPLTQAQ